MNISTTEGRPLLLGGMGRTSIRTHHRDAKHPGILEWLFLSWNMIREEDLGLNDLSILCIRRIFYFSCDVPRKAHITRRKNNSADVAAS